MFNTSIKKKVMKVIEQKIKDAQDAHDDEIEQLKTDHDLQRMSILDEAKEKVFHLDEYHEIQKDAIAEKHVNSIISKLI